MLALGLAPSDGIQLSPGLSVQGRLAGNAGKLYGMILG
jgi:hypothetical protein